MMKTIRRSAIIVIPTHAFNARIAEQYITNVFPVTFARRFIAKTPIHIVANAVAIVRHIVLNAMGTAKIFAQRATRCIVPGEMKNRVIFLLATADIAIITVILARDIAMTSARHVKQNIALKKMKDHVINRHAMACIASIIVANAKVTVICCVINNIFIAAKSAVNADQIFIAFGRVNLTARRNASCTVDKYAVNVRCSTADISVEHVVRSIVAHEMFVPAIVQKNAINVLLKSATV